MRALAAVGIGAYVLVSLAVGIRLLFLWRRTRKLPELLLAMAVLGIGFVGFALAAAVKLFLTPTPSMKMWGPVFGLVPEYTGSLALALFAWRVFHPERRWALVVVTGIGATMLAAFAAEVLSREHLHYLDGSAIGGPQIPLALAARALAPAWMAFECLRYHGMLRRRLKLGLAEPLVVNRFALWGIAIGAATCGYGVSIAHRCVYGTGLQAHVWAMDLVALTAVIAATGITLAFFPPGRYRRWIDRRAGGGGIE